MTKPLRETMPITAAWLDELGEAFGYKEIGQAIRAGLAGQPTFWAREGGVEIGTKAPEPVCAVSGADMVLRDLVMEERVRRGRYAG